jgi:hypothetical protein
MLVNKVEVLSNALEIVNDHSKLLSDVLKKSESGEMRKIIAPLLAKDQDMMESIIKDFRSLSDDYVAPMPDGFRPGREEEETEDGDGEEPISKVTMKMTEKG